MKFKLFSFLAIAILFASCDNPDEWTDERKQVLTDKCDTDLYDCDCYVETTVKAFPKAQDYNKTLENESANEDKIDAYYEELAECMAE
jgi:hypothetical protein